MIEKNKIVWKKLEENIGRCILFKEAAMKEALGEDSFALQFATLSVPEKVEAFLNSTENIKIFRNEPGNYIFIMDGAKIEVRCFDAGTGLEKTYEKMFGRTFRCENLGINILGRYNRNVGAYNDIMAKELHFATADVKLNEFLIGKILRYVLDSGFSVGNDILEYVVNNRTFENKTMKDKFLGSLADSLRRNKFTWNRVAEALKLIKNFFPDQNFIRYTAGLTEKDKNSRFIRNYLYNLFITLNTTGQELQTIMPNEPTLEYFDSLAINVSACLGEYKVYMEIKNKYGEEFLELLMDVQESIAVSLGMDYARVSDETFDMGKLFFNDERFWCSLEEMKKQSVPEVNRIASEIPEEQLDASKGNVAEWMADIYNKDMYSDATEPEEDKVYIDDDAEQETVNAGIDKAALEVYEDEFLSEEKNEDISAVRIERSKQNDGIMNSQRGHESRVLNSGGV